MAENYRIGSALAVVTVVLAIFISLEILGKYTRVKTETTRKLAHVLSGTVTLFFPYLFPLHITVLALSVLFTLFMAISSKFRFLESVNGIERRSYGSIVYPVAIYICFFVFRQKNEWLYYFLPVLILVICDPLAALAGMNIKSAPYSILKNSKSVAGSLVFFAAAFIVSVCLISQLPHSRPAPVLGHSFVLALTTTVAEGISPLGLDNLLIPLCAIAGIYFLCIPC